MNKISEKNKKLIKISSIVVAAIILITIVLTLIIKYNVEGEKNLPFKIVNLKIASTAQANNIADAENRWNLDIIQKNDFYFYIEKNPNYKKEDSISKITFENFKIEKKLDNTSVGIYKPSSNSILYSYTDDYKVDNSITYSGNLSTNISALEIGNQGGLIGFSIAQTLGNYTTNDDAEVIHNGLLVAKLNLNSDDIHLKITFDVIIETTSNKKFKATLSFDLPSGNIVEDGVSILNKDNFDDVVFKRV